MLFGSKFKVQRVPLRCTLGTVWKEGYDVWEDERCESLERGGWLCFQAFLFVSSVTGGGGCYWEEVFSVERDMPQPAIQSKGMFEWCRVDIGPLLKHDTPPLYPLDVANVDISARYDEIIKKIDRIRLSEIWYRLQISHALHLWISRSLSEAI